MVHETVTMQGHLIDSDILRRAFARIVEEGGDFDVQEFRVGKTNDDPSFIRLGVSAAHCRDAKAHSHRFTTNLKWSAGFG